MTNSQKNRLIKHISKYFPGYIIFQEIYKKDSDNISVVYSCYVEGGNFSDTDDFWSNEHTLNVMVNLINELCFNKVNTNKKYKPFSIPK